MSSRRVKKWSYSIAELLKDPAGREQFEKFLEREFSRENLKYACSFSLFSFAVRAHVPLPSGTSVPVPCALVCSPSRAEPMCVSESAQSRHSSSVVSRQPRRPVRVLFARAGSSRRAAA